MVAGVLPEGAICREFDVLTNNWLVELNHAGGERVARSVAADTGFTFVAPVSTPGFLLLSVCLVCLFVGCTALRGCLMGIETCFTSAISYCWSIGFLLLLISFVFN